MDVISKTVYALRQLERNIDHGLVKQLREAIDLTRVVTFTGVGKSFGVAQLGASLLQSVGYHATAIHTTDLLHGGLGTILAVEHSVVIFVSHSGETTEILDALYIVERQTQDRVITVAVTGNQQSELAERCTIALGYRIDEDGSIHGTIPSVSVAVQLAIINTLVCDIANLLTPQELGACHPSGALHEKYEEKIHND